MADEQCVLLGEQAVAVYAKSGAVNGLCQQPQDSIGRQVVCARSTVYRVCFS